MPFDVLGGTRNTLMNAESFFLIWKDLDNLLKVHRAWDSALQLWRLNEEFLVSASHHLALITSLPFVHTARHSYRLNDQASSSDLSSSLDKKVVQA